MFLAYFTAGLVALLHLYFLVLEMFLWTHPIGLRTFQMDREFAQRSKALALNQGLYNGFLAAGLLYGIITNSSAFVIFFLSCVVLAGILGGITVSKRIFLVQGMPALVSLFINLLVTR